MIACMGVFDPSFSQVKHQYRKKIVMNVLDSVMLF